MKRLIKSIKEIYHFYVDVYIRLSRNEDTEFPRQNDKKKMKSAKVIPFVPRDELYDKNSKNQKEKHLKKIKQSECIV